jgi:hypothetical protein
MITMPVMKEWRVRGRKGHADVNKALVIARGKAKASVRASQWSAQHHGR